MTLHSIKISLYNYASINSCKYFCKQRIGARLLVKMALYKYILYYSLLYIYILILYLFTNSFYLLFSIVVFNWSVMMLYY